MREMLTPTPLGWRNAEYMGFLWNALGHFATW
jgi:hypothetical protein